MDEKRQYRWRQKAFKPPDTVYWPKSQLQVNDVEMQTPLQYFRTLITEDMLKQSVAHTTQYRLQKTGTCANTSVKEPEQLIGMVLRIGTVQMPGIRVYWESNTRYGPEADIMSRNRFQLLLRCLHFVDNEGVTDDKNLIKCGHFVLYSTCFAGNACLPCQTLNQLMK